MSSASLETRLMVRSSWVSSRRYSPLRRLWIWVLKDFALMS